MLNGVPVTLPEMLACREIRYRLQQKYLAEYQTTLVSFCLNIPGPIKTSPELRKVFDCGLAAVCSSLQEGGFKILARQECHERTGDEFLLAVNGSAEEIKRLMTDIEEDHPLGRLFDIDVLTAAGQKLSRPLPRRCLICQEQAQVCASRRLHSVAAMTAKIENILLEYFQKQE